MTSPAKHRSYQRALMAGSSYVATVWSGEADESGRRALKSGASGPVFGGQLVIFDPDPQPDVDPEGASRKFAGYRHELETSTYRK